MKKILLIFVILGALASVAGCILGLSASEVLASPNRINGSGNLIDRIYRGYVIDYIHVKIINFAIFNFADICVTVGTAMLVCYLLFHELLGRKKEEPAGA